MVSRVEEKIQTYINKHPELKNLSNSKIISIMISGNELNTTEVKELSLIFPDNQDNSNNGLSLEKTEKETTSTTQTERLNLSQSKETSITLIADNINEAQEVYNSQSLGVISSVYDKHKADDNILSSSNVKKVLDYQKSGLKEIIEAKNNNLSRRQYYKNNRERIKEMVLTRLNVLKTQTGVKLLDVYKGEYSDTEIKEILDKYIDSICINKSMKDLKSFQQEFASLTVSDEIIQLKNIVDRAKDYNKIQLSKQANEGKSINLLNSSVIPPKWDSDEKISFEEVYKIERGTEYSDIGVERYVQAKSEMNTVINAYNKKQQFVDFANDLRSKKITSEEKAQKLVDGYTDYYLIDGGKNELKKIIDKSGLPVVLDENGINLSAIQDEGSKNRALNTLLQIASLEKEKEFTEFLGGKSIEDYQQEYENSSNAILGKENAKMLAQAMKDDNLSVIQRYTGNISMAGMGLTVVGGVLCFTPAAPLGAGLIAAGNSLAIGGMITKTAAGAVDYATKDVQTSEEFNNLAKDFVTDAGGFIIGYKASKTGIKAFNKLIDKKLTEVFSKEISQGNRAQALKSVFSDSECLKNFITAGGVKLGTDFVISYAGDLAMMGILDTKDDWRSLLQANLTGILVGMSGDIKDVAGVGRKAKLITSEHTVQNQYRQSSLGMDARIKDKTSSEQITGTMSKVKIEDGRTPVKVEGKHYSTDDIVNVKEQTVATKGPKLDEVKFETIKLSSMVVRQNDKYIIKPEYERQIRDFAQQIRQKALDAENEIVTNMKQCGLEISNSHMTHRAKSEQSLYDKIKNYVIDNAEKPKTFDDAIKCVHDFVGTRTILNNKDYTQHPEVAKLLKEGKEKEAIARAAEIQSQEMVNILKAFLIRQKNGDNPIEAIKINNYTAKDGIPYISEAQLAELQNTTAIDIVLRVPENDEKAKNILSENGTTTKIRDSGYTAFQMNFKTKNGEIFEWQFRGTEINRFAEAEHVPYDLRTDKDIIGDNKNLECLYNPIKDLLNKDSMSEDDFNAYNKYLTDHYNYLRKIELGFKAQKPNLTSYGNFDKRLSAENLEILHDIVDELKKSKITKQEAVLKYQSCIK